MHARNGPKPIPFQSGCKSTHFIHNFQTLYDLFFHQSIFLDLNQQNMQIIANRKENEHLFAYVFHPIFSLYLKNEYDY